MSSALPVLITGATGKQGGATARKLLAEGHPVRALVRDPAAPAARALAEAGARLAIGDFDDPASLRTAAAGTRAVFLIPPAEYRSTGWTAEDEARRGIAMLDAARATGVEQIVFSGIATMGPADSWGQDGKRRIEDAIHASGLRYTLLRPVRFMENYLLEGSPVDGVRANGEHPHLFPADRPLQMIALADIAVFAALALADPESWHGRALELAGDAITPVDAAAAISTATGRTIRYREVTEAEAEAIGPHLGNTWRLIRESGGWQADLPALRELYPRLTSLSEWLSSGGAARILARLEDSTPVARAPAGHCHADPPDRADHCRTVA
ncbi:NmrA/HSCARG family protein [Nocardia neocaledoniensis]|uniref:NmrA/HSCARG family protein n=1 Tax=Nocardia neocaledoniensis TaxID=236511 RepID=UPI0024571807|nr:NmrA/HSCARG family protein [Nocardia neocaledoniensis]